MPQHTGTATIHPWLVDHASEMGINLKLSFRGSQLNKPRFDGHGCLHSHEQAFPPNTSTSFSFIANPFRRVLSAAAHYGAISGGRVARTKPITEEIDDFRHFVAHRMCAMNHRMIPHCIWQQNSLLKGFPRPLLLYDTANLAEGFASVLRALGYPHDIFKGFTQIHCSATCLTPLDDRAASREGETPLVHKIAANRTWKDLQHLSDKRLAEWYNDSTAQIVIKAFAHDFRVFGYSQDPAHMWDTRGQATKFEVDYQATCERPPKGCGQRQLGYRWSASLDTFALEGPDLV